MKRALNLALIVVAVVNPIAVQALDLTGSWQGAEKCTHTNFVGHSKTKYNSDNVIVAITQVSSDLNVQISAGHFSLAPKFNGRATGSPSDTNKGLGSILNCLNDPSIALNGIIKAKTDGTSGKMTISSQVFDASGFYVCKYKLERLDTLNPGITACP